MPGGEWFGPAEAGEVKTVDGERGAVAGSGRWWSMRWWSGHWDTRDQCGEFTEEGKEFTCDRRRGHRGKHRPSTGARSAQNRAGAQSDHRAYLEARQSQAEAATAGNMVNAAGRRAGITGSSFFTGRKPPMRYASEELRDWFRDNGANLSATNYARQAAGGSTTTRRGWFA